MADYQWIQNLRSAPALPATATRKQEIESTLDTLRKMQPMYHTFSNKPTEYQTRTHDPRATSLLAREKILLGDTYLNVLSRYDMAITRYQEALQIDPANTDA